MDWLWAKRSRRRVRGLGHPRPGRGRLAPLIPEPGQAQDAATPHANDAPPNTQTPPGLPPRRDGASPNTKGSDHKVGRV